MQIKQIENRLRSIADKVWQLDIEQISFTSMRNVRDSFNRITRQKALERNYRKIQNGKEKT